MEPCKLHDGEYRLVSIVWDHEPVGSGELVRLCGEELGWKKSTTYTMLRKLCDRGVLQNAGAVVTARVGREDVRKYESERLLRRSFGGSLPCFVTAFLSDKRLTAAEADELTQLIERHRGQETE